MKVAMITPDLQSRLKLFLAALTCVFVVGCGAKPEEEAAPTTASSPAMTIAPAEQPDETPESPIPGPNEPLPAPEAPPAPAPVPAPAPPATPTPVPPATPSAIRAAQARALLASIPIKGRAPKTGYSREMFGQRWKDIDGNGCDQRNDVLARDLHQAIAPAGCKVTEGILEDPYTGTTIPFLRGAKTSSAVQIDHVVALADAWQKGAQQLSPEEREQFANDPANLLAVDGPTNVRKGAADAATWLPPHVAFRCDYAAIQTEVKARYRLWTTQAEHDVLDSLLADCSRGVAP